MSLKPKTFQEALAKHKPLRRTGFIRKATESLNTLKSKPLQRRRKRMRGIRIDPADKWFSLYVRTRANWCCERCGTQYEVGAQGLHASHFWGRARESTRFDPMNVSAHCHGCHSLLTANPELHREWKLKQIGHQQYDLLMVRAQLTHKKDRKLMAIVWRQEYLKEQLRYEQECS